MGYRTVRVYGKCMWEGGGMWGENGDEKWELVSTVAIFFRFHLNTAVPWYPLYNAHRLLPCTMTLHSGIDPRLSSPFTSAPWYLERRRNRFIRGWWCT